MRVILLDHKRYCLINKMVLARAAYNFAEGDLGTRLYLPPPQALCFLVFRTEESARLDWLVTKHKRRLPLRQIFIERETSRSKAEIIRFGNPRWYPLSLRELRTRFKSVFSLSRNKPPAAQAITLANNCPAVNKIQVKAFQAVGNKKKYSSRPASEPYQRNLNFLCPLPEG